MESEKKVNIQTNANSFLESVMPKITKKFGITKEEIMEEYEKALAEVGKVPNAETLAWRKTVTALETMYGSWRSPAIMINAYVIGESGLIDIVETRHKPHSRIIGFVDANGVELDYRETIFKNTPNPQFNQPYSNPEYEREIYAIVSENETFDNCKLVRLLARFDVAENLFIECWKFYKVRVSIPKATQDQTRLTYTITKASKFVEINPNIAPYELINKIDTIPISRAIDAVEMVKDLKPYEQGIYAVSGFIMSVQREIKESSKSMVVRIGDEFGNSMIAMFPKFFKLNVGEGSDIVVFGTLFKLQDTPAIRGVGYLVGELSTPLQ